MYAFEARTQEGTDKHTYPNYNIWILATFALVLLPVSCSIVCETKSHRLIVVDKRQNFSRQAYERIYRRKFTDEYTYLIFIFVDSFYRVFIQ